MKSINQITCENLLHNLPGMFYRCQNDPDWTMDWVSSGCFDLTGYESKELIKNTVVSYGNLVHPDDREWLWEKCSKNLNNQQVCNNEYRIISKLGKIKWVREVANGIYNKNGQLEHIEGYIQDITAEREERMLSRVFQSYLNVIDKSSIVSITNEKGEIIYGNDLFMEVSQYDRSELIGQTHRVINSKFHPDEFFKEMWSTIKSGKIWKGEIKNRAKDGSYYWVDAFIAPIMDSNSEIVNYLSIRNLITDKKEKEIELIESERFNREILSSFLSNIAVLDEDGKIISTNDAWRNFSVSNDCPDLSKTSEGANYFEVCEKALATGDQLAGEVLKGVKDLFKKENALFQIEYPCHSENVKRWFLLSATSLKGNSKRIVIRHVDITKRKIAEQKLAESEKKYRSIIENSHELILTLDINGNIIFANNSWESVLGYSDKDLLQKNFFELLSPNVQAKCGNYFNEVIGGKALYAVDSELIKKDGGLIFIESNAVPLLDEKKVVGVQLFIRNVTNKKLVEFELVKSESRYRRVFESVQDVIYAISSEGKFISLNAAFEKLSGYKVEEWIGRSFVELVHPDDLPKAMDAFNKVIRGEQVDVYTLRLRNSIGEYRICELTPGAFILENEVVESLGLARDVTERILSEQKLKESEERFNLALKGANDGLWDWNLITNEVYFSPRWKKMIGYEDHELENTFDTWVTLIHPDDFSYTLEKLNDYLSGRSDEYNVEFRLRHKNGEYIDVLARGFLITDNEGNNLRITGTHLDMTELNVKKIQLQKLIDELSKKYNDLMQFNYIISHNLRTPVASILGLATLLKFPDNSEEEKEKIIKNILLSTEKVDEVLKDLTNIISVREPINVKRTDVQVKELISAVSYMLNKRIEEVDAKIIVDVEEDCQTITTIKPYFESILYNLLLNSLKYISPERSPVIYLKLKRITGGIEFQISDNGIGIDLLKHRDKMFGLYKRFNNDVEGRGLGLFMTKMQVEAIGGNIFVESTVNEGTTFTVHFIG